MLDLTLPLKGQIKELQQSHYNEASWCSSICFWGYLEAQVGGDGGYMLQVMSSQVSCTWCHPTVLSALYYQGTEFPLSCLSFLITPPASELCVLYASAFVSDTGRWGDSPTLDLGLTAKPLSHTHHQEPLPGSSSMTPGIVWSSGLPIGAYSPFPSPLSKTTAISCSLVTILKFCRAFIWHHVLAPSPCIA